MSKVDTYQEVTNRILEELEKGTVPWRKPWRDVAGFGPSSLSTGREYQGINSLLLSLTAMSRGYQSRWWATFNQAKARDGMVRRGEKGTRVILWKPVSRSEAEKAAGKSDYLYLTSFVVFNLEQCDNLEEPEPTILEPSAFSPSERAEQLVEGMPHPRVKIDRTGTHGGRAFYHPSLDYVHVPAAETFEDSDAFYSVLFHELAHATGHESRLDRPGITDRAVTFGSDGYAREELIAEIAACLLLADAGLEPRYEQSAAYLDTWRAHLSRDPRLIVQAASQAFKAAAWIRGDTSGVTAAPLAVAVTA